MISGAIHAFRVPALLFMLMGSALGQPASMKWPEAVALLAAERTRAETCVALLKKYGSDSQKATGQFAYANAKSDSDAVIAGLVTAISTGQESATLSSLKTTLERGASRLAEFCNSVGKLLPAAGGEKSGLWTAILQAPGVIEQALKMIEAGVSALYNDYRKEDALTRATIKTQLEAARWPAYSDVKPAE